MTGPENDADLLHDLLDGCLAPGAERELHARLLREPALRRRLEELERVVGGLRELRSERAPADFALRVMGAIDAGARAGGARRPTWLASVPALAAAAGLALAAGLGVAYFGGAPAPGKLGEVRDVARLDEPPAARANAPPPTAGFAEDSTAAPATEAAPPAAAGDKLLAGTPADGPDRADGAENARVFEKKAEQQRGRDASDREVLSDRTQAGAIADAEPLAARLKRLEVAAAPGETGGLEAAPSEQRVAKSANSATPAPIRILRVAPGSKRKAGAAADELDWPAPPAARAGLLDLVPEELRAECEALLAEHSESARLVELTPAELGDFVGRADARGFEVRELGPAPSGGGKDDLAAASRGLEWRRLEAPPRLATGPAAGQGGTAAGGGASSRAAPTPTVPSAPAPGGWSAEAATESIVVLLIREG